LVAAKNIPEAIITGFPEIVRYQYRCRLCKLAKNHSGLLRQVHDWRQSGERDRSFEKRVNELLERHGVSKIDRRAIERHFEKHVDFSDEVEAVAAAFRMPEAADMQRLLDEDEGVLVQDSLVEDDNDGTDYHHMWDLFRRIFRRIKALDADPIAFLNDDGNSTNHYKLTMWVKLISEARSLLEGLNKMRNNDRLVVAILEGHTKRFAIQLIDSVKVEILPQIETLRERGQGDIADQLESTIRRRLPNVFTNVAVDSLQNSKEEYNLMH
jgi:hypothetical protein